jgi:hypothetical protein
LGWAKISSVSFLKEGKGDAGSPSPFNVLCYLERRIKGVAINEQVCSSLNVCTQDSSGDTNIGSTRCVGLSITEGEFIDEYFDSAMGKSLIGGNPVA